VAAALARFEERLGGLQARADQARGHAAEAEAALAETGEALQRWLAESAAVRQKLADGAGRSI